MTKATIEHVKTEALIPYARNSRTHSEQQVAQIAASIREFGFTNPVLIDAENGIIAGHGRVMAAQKLGRKDVPCLRLDHLTDAQKRAYVLADNQLALNAGWDDEMLRIELDELNAVDFDISLIGFDDDELKEISFDNDADAEMPLLYDSDRAPYRQMTFTLHDDQAEAVEAAIKAAKNAGEFVGSLNENSNGNALARICEAYNEVG